MELHEFSSEMGRLINVFSDKAYPKERMALIYEKMHFLEVADFRDIVSILIGECAQAPLLPRFQEAAKAHYAKHRERLDKEEALWIEKQAHCELCNRTGVITARRKDNWAASFAFKCVCAVGERKQFNYPSWFLCKNKDLYDLDRHYETLAPNEELLRQTIQGITKSFSMPLPYDPKEMLSEQDKELDGF